MTAPTIDPDTHDALLSAVGAARPMKQVYADKWLHHAELNGQTLFFVCRPDGPPLEKAHRLYDAYLSLTAQFFAIEQQLANQLKADLGGRSH